MNSAIAEEWAAALESGEYQQGQEMLCVNGKHCCLGVLCRLAIKHGVDLFVAEQGGVTVITNFGMRTMYLPQEVQKWAGLESDCGKYDAEKNLAYDNDKGKTFAEIAAIIREHKETL